MALQLVVLSTGAKKDKPRVARTKHQEQTQTATIYLDLYRQSGLPISMELTTVREFMAGLSLERLQQFKASLDANLSKSFGILPAFIAEPDLGVGIIDGHK